MIGSTGGNIIEIYHQRLFFDLPVKRADVDVVVETRTAAMSTSSRAPETGGFPTRVLGDLGG